MVHRLAVSRPLWPENVQGIPAGQVKVTRISLHYRILLGMAIGLLVGLGMNAWGDKNSPVFVSAIWWLDLFGKDLFIGALKMIIAPLIFSTIIAGVTSLPRPKEIGSIGIKIMLYYASTTAIAVALGILAVQVIQPGKRAASQVVRADREKTFEEYRAAYAKETGKDATASENYPSYMEYVRQREGAGLAGSDFSRQWDAMRSVEELGPAETFRRGLLNPILTNPFTALSESPPNTLGIIAFALLTGLACLIAGENAHPVSGFFRAFSGIMMTITLWIMELAPYSIGCIIASMVGTLGVQALQSLGWYCATIIVGIGIHVIVLLGIASTVGRISPWDFLRGIRDAWMVAFTTTSSAATLPLTLHCVTKKLKVSDKIANFSLPVGATMNMDGTALYEGVAIIFLIQMYGGLDDVSISLTGINLFIIFITAVFASIGAAAVPSAGLITMAIVASAVGLPLYYIYIIYAVDHMLDMFRTSTNVLGDAVGAVVVNRLEAGKLGESPARPKPA